MKTKDNIKEIEKIISEQGLPKYFWENTIINWKDVTENINEQYLFDNYPMHEISNGVRYYYAENGVYRIASHWGRLTDKSIWLLNGNVRGGRSIGFVPYYFFSKDKFRIIWKTSNKGNRVMAIHNFPKYGEYIIEHTSNWLNPNIQYIENFSKRDIKLASPQLKELFQLNNQEALEKIVELQDNSLLPFQVEIKSTYRTETLEKLMKEL